MAKKYKLEISEPHIEDTETGECYDLHGKDNLMYIVELWNKIVDENEQLKKENHGIQDKVIRLLDYVEVKQCVTRTEIKKWWNGDDE